MAKNLQFRVCSVKLMEAQSRCLSFSFKIEVGPLHFPHFMDFIILKSQLFGFHSRVTNPEHSSHLRYVTKAQASFSSSYWFHFHLQTDSETVDLPAFSLNL
jgi:hypothetical protein